MKVDFKLFTPSKSLTNSLIDYHGREESRYSGTRIDVTSTHAPEYGSEVSVDKAMESVSERLHRMVGTLIRRTAVISQYQVTKVPLTENGNFTNQVADMVRERLNIKQDTEGDFFLQRLAQELKNFIISNPNHGLDLAVNSLGDIELVLDQKLIDLLTKPQLGSL